MKFKTTLRAMIAAPALCLMASAAFAQAFPNKPLKLVLPYSPGGIIDYVGRTMANALSGPLGQPVIAENRPGAGGITGTDTVARAAPDGYNLVLMDPAIVINPTLQPSMPYDLFKQLATVSIISTSPEVVVVSPELPIKNIADLIAYGKANPGKLNFASAGIGTTPHLAGELFKQRTGIEATHVPYKSIGQSYPDLMGNKVQFAFSSIAGALPFTTDNRVRPIATSGTKRSSVYPDLPTVQEAGLAGFEVDLWLGIFAPVATPPDVVEKLNAAIQTVLKDPETIKALAKVGVEPRGTSAKDGEAFLKNEFGKWKKVIEDGNIKDQ
ncbi:MAG: extra-cytoplasmic solute receptor [Hyphomicrobiales bacterium]|jgi:tripartite-type tricarboxylate transporter receptor subunit TctC|nr:extra-cytoplasmic solute receptor [Hyphomicrobiales bacterium]